MMQDRVDYRLGVLCVTASAVAWSTAGFFTRLIPLDGWTILFWRGVFSGLFIAGYIVWQYRGDTLRVYRSMGRPGWLFAVCSAVGMTTFIPALKLTTVADVAVIYATAPFVTAALAWIWLRERPRAATWIASTLAFVGVLVTLGGSGFGADLWGDLLAFTMTVAVAVAMVISPPPRHPDGAGRGAVDPVRLARQPALGASRGGRADRTWSIWRCSDSSRWPWD